MCIQITYRGQLLMLPGQTRSGQTSLYQISWKHTKANTTKNKEVCVYSRGRGKLFASNNNKKDQNSNISTPLTIRSFISGANLGCSQTQNAGIIALTPNTHHKTCMFTRLGKAFWPLRPCPDQWYKVPNSKPSNLSSIIGPSLK